MNASAQGQESTSQAVHRYWVLIVEDDPDERDYLQSLLERHGVGVVATENLRDAGRRMELQKFDCLILDLNLGHESGEKLLGLVHDDRGSYNYRVPVIVVSGNLDSDVIKRLRGQVQHMLVKPFNENQLMSKLFPIFHSHDSGTAA